MRNIQIFYSHGFSAAWYKRRGALSALQLKSRVLSAFSRETTKFLLLKDL